MHGLRGLFCNLWVSEGVLLFRFVRLPPYDEQFQFCFRRAYGFVDNRIIPKETRLMRTSSICFPKFYDDFLSLTFSIETVFASGSHGFSVSFVIASVLVSILCLSILSFQNDEHFSSASE